MTTVFGRNAPMIGRASARFLIAILALTATSAAALAAPLPGYFGGGAAAAQGDATLGVVAVELANLAVVGCPCQGTDGKTLTNQVGAVTLPGLITVAGTTSTAFANKNAKKAVTRQTATIAGLNLLGGLVTADGITASATVKATATDLDASAAGSGFVKLMIAGKPVDPNIKANTKLKLPGFGLITVKSIMKTGNGTSDAGVTVAMLNITIDEKNVLGLPIGATISVGFARADFNRAQPKAVVAGVAYVANANLAAGTLLLTNIGALDIVGVGSCAGDGVLHTKTVAGVNVAGLVTIGAGTATGFGGPTGKHTTLAQTTATIGSIGLLGGLIGADSIKAVATETAVGKTVTASTQGTEFGNLTVLGIPLPLNVPANTMIALPLLGYVVVNEQTVPQNGQGTTVVNGLHIVINTPNILGLPVGTEIELAHAEANAYPEKI